MKIGSRIRSIRKKRGLTIAELANQSSISTSLVSQAERDNIAPSLGTLSRISKSLGIPLASLFTEEPAKPAILRYKPKTPGDGDVSRRTPHPGDMPRLKSETLRLAPGVAIDLHANGDQHGFGIVLRGTVELTVRRKTEHLEEKDAVYLRSPEDARLFNKYIEPAEVLWLWLASPLD